MWQQAGQIGQEHFWSGVGLGNYSLQFEPGLDYRNPMTAHNLYLDIFSEMGIFALVVWLILILGSLWLIYKNLLILPKNSPQAWLCLGLIGSLVYYAAHSVFETSIYHPVVLSILMVVLALSSITVREAEQ